MQVFNVWGILKQKELINIANKELKNRTQIGSAIDKKLYEELKNYSKETSIPISKLLDKAIKMFLESTK